MFFLSIIVAAIAGFATGAVWYMLNGARWMQVVGRTKQEMAADKSPLPFIIAFAASLLTAGMMAHVFATTGLAGFFPGLVAGLGFGLFMIAPWVATNYAFANRPRTLWWIDGGHVILVATVIGAVLGLFG
ncbi:MAG: DUF1761 domain-containing protein [Pseudomonadota bacterium]